MNKYNKLPIPNNSIWERKTWRKYTPIWVINIVDSIKNLINWFPIIWQDRHWDDVYITKILQKKIELQRKHIVANNRHSCVGKDNFWMTIVLNLLDKKLNESYEEEYLDIFYPKNDVPEKKLINNYINKHKKILSRVIKRYNISSEKDLLSNKRLTCLYIARYRQEKCNNLLFEILKQKSANWWD